MTGQPRDLARIQRWMQSVIKHPDGVAAGIDDAKTREQIDIGVDQVSQVIRPSKALTEIERLSIYANAYYARLLEVLREEYPALAHGLEDELFDGFAFGYLQAHPSGSYTLADLGAKFPQYLAETRPENEEPEAGPDWADLMIDLARLERAYAEIFDGPGTEGTRCLEAADLLSISPERWGDVTLVPAPCLRLMTFQFPVHEYASAVRKNESPTPPAPAVTYLALNRRDFVVRREPLSEVAFHLLTALANGKSLARAIEEATTACTISDEELGPLLHAWFAQWTALRFFVRVELND